MDEQPVAGCNELGARVPSLARALCTCGNSTQGTAIRDKGCFLSWRGVHFVYGVIERCPHDAASRRPSDVEACTPYSRLGAAEEKRLLCRPCGRWQKPCLQVTLRGASGRPVTARIAEQGTPGVRGNSRHWPRGDFAHLTPGPSPVCLSEPPWHGRARVAGTAPDCASSMCHAVVTSVDLYVVALVAGRRCELHMQAIVGGVHPLHGVLSGPPTVGVI